MADAYGALARYARDPDGSGLAASATALAGAAEALAAGPPESASRGALRALVEEGEWIRFGLAALARATSRGTPARDCERGDDAPAAVAAVLAAAATALEAIAASLLRRGGGKRDVAAAMAALRRRVAALGPGPARRTAATLLARIAAAASRHGGDAAAARSRDTDGALAVLRAQLTLRSSALRHAVRLAVALMIAVVAYRSLSLGWGYWVPLTVLFVLKPDYSATFSRAIGRAAGTMLGVAIAWAIVTALSPADGTIVALLTLLTLAAYALYPANYALFSVLLTVVVALLAEFGGGSPIGALEDRLLDTAVGGAIALAAFALWPTREAATLDHRLAVLVDRQRRWLGLVLAAFQDDAAYDRAALHDRRLATRRARADAEAAAGRAQAEPAHWHPDRRLAAAVLAAIERLSESTVVLAATLHAGARIPTAALSPFERGSDRCLAVVAESLEAAAWRPPPLPREETLALDHAAAGAAGDDPLAAVVAPEARLILAALVSLAREAEAAKPPGDLAQLPAGRLAAHP